MDILYYPYLFDALLLSINSVDFVPRLHVLHLLKYVLTVRLFIERFQVCSTLVRWKMAFTHCHVTSPVRLADMMKKMSPEII